MKKDMLLMKIIIAILAVTAALLLFVFIHLLLFGVTSVHPSTPETITIFIPDDY